MKFTYFYEPNSDKTFDLIDSGLRKRAMMTIFSKCKATYDGRAKSQLDYGERMILIKADGSFMIHQDRALDPVNWQPPKSKTKVKMKDGKVILESHRRAPKELLEVILDEVKFISYCLLTDFEELEKSGLEEDMREMIMKDPDLIEKGFKPSTKEYCVESGYIDILGKDKDGNTAILELKSRKAGTNAVKQIRRYLKDFSDSKEKVRGILVAPGIVEDAKELMEEEGIEFKELHPPNELKNEKKVTLDIF